MTPDPERLDVDARFLLANERTLLAWVRTALTLIVSGAGVAEFADRVSGRMPLALMLVGLGITAAGTGAVRHINADRAIRHGRLPHGPGAPIFVAVLVALVGLGALVAIVVTPGP